MSRNICSDARCGWTLLACLAWTTLPRDARALPGTADVTPAQAASVLYQREQELRSETTGTRRDALGERDALVEYAEQCDLLTGLHVPPFNCDLGTKVPGQGTTPAGLRSCQSPGASGPICDKPNVLNCQCDPGSRFQVLAKSADAAVVAHCRKVGLPETGSTYNDIAVIQYNRVNGAVCFYQALTDLEGSDVRAPSEGIPAWSWKSPEDTVVLGCTGCHDSGGFIRSPYLAQLLTAPHVLPSSADGFNNLNTPMHYVGSAYAASRSWSIAPVATCRPGESCQPCNSCHRLAVNNFSGSGLGTAIDFGIRATAKRQTSKTAHSATSPIWMRPNQVTHTDEAQEAAEQYRDCALAFVKSNFVDLTTSKCSMTPLGTPWRDADDDLVDDTDDNCPALLNPYQQDSDQDGRGDACDNCRHAANSSQSDLDQDAVGDACDNCPNLSNGDQLNTDGLADGGDACDGDDDEDGCSDDADDKPKEASAEIGWRVAANCPDSLQSIYGWDGEDTDGDRVLNCADDDDDGDGLLDTADACPVTEGGEPLTCQYAPTSCALTGFWDTCLRGGCSDLVLKVVSAGNPSWDIEDFEVQAGRVILRLGGDQTAQAGEAALLGQGLSSVVSAEPNALVLSPPQAAAQTVTLEMWTRGSTEEPGRLIARVAAYQVAAVENDLSVRGELRVATNATKATVLALAK